MISLQVFVPLRIWFKDASILIIKVAGTVIVSLVSSNITSFLSINYEIKKVIYILDQIFMKFIFYNSYLK